MDYRRDMGASAEKQAGSSRIARFMSGGLCPVTIVLCLYFALSLAIRLMLPDALTLDEAEQALFSQYWLAGYGPQPPFYNWVQNAFVAVMGISLLSLALPKFMMLLLVYVFFGLAAREIDRRPGFVAMAVLSLLTLPQVSYMPQQDLTHTVAILMATSLFFYGLLRMLRRADCPAYVILGLAIGIGTISKYNFALLPAAAVIAIFCDRQWRPRLFDPRVLLTALVGLIIILPHALWLTDHIEIATQGTLDKMGAAAGIEGAARITRALLSLVLACAAFGALTVVVFAIGFKSKFLPALRTGDRWTRLLGLIMLVSLAGVVVIILVTGTTKITERWLDPYLLVLPLYLLLKLDLAGASIGASLRRFLPLFIAIMAITLAPLAGSTLTAGLTGDYQRLNYPFAIIAERLKAEDRPSLIVADDMHLAGNMRLQFPETPVVRPGAQVPGFPSVEAMRGPVLFIWRAQSADASENIPPAIDQMLAAHLLASVPQVIAEPYIFGDGEARLRLGYIWLKP